MIFRTIADMRKQVGIWKSKNLSVGLVPTMGGLHEGHIALVQSAKKKCDRVITTIFVNPTQFGVDEDLAIYPRSEESDCEVIAGAGGSAVFIPSILEMYPEGFLTTVCVSELTDKLCGASRPGHFDGVTQVVSKLLNQANADVAFFGEKDWQQLTIIRRLAVDLNIPTSIKGVPTVRDKFGLALSSRNGYLDFKQTEKARLLSSVLSKAAYDIASGSDASLECAKVVKILLGYGFDRIDYIECRNAHSLELIERADIAECRIFAAVYLGNVRLIDNHAIL